MRAPAPMPTPIPILEPVESPESLEVLDEGEPGEPATGVSDVDELSREGDGVFDKVGELLGEEGVCPVRVV